MRFFQHVLSLREMILQRCGNLRNG